MAATPKLVRKGASKMVAHGRKKIREQIPNKSVRTEKAKANIAEHGKHATKRANKLVKSMYS